SSRLSYVLAPNIAVALLASQACGGGQVSEDPPPVCYLSHPIPDGGMMRNLRANEWASLVVRGFREGQQSTQDCVGNPIEWRPTDPQCEVHEDENEPAPRPVEITEESVVVGRSDTVAVKPVWVITHRFEDGDGFGPVAVTERTPEGVAVRAIGTLRLPTERARLRLRETGGHRILVADGERCPREDDEENGDPDSAPPANAGDGGDGEQRATCLRTSRLLPMVGDRLLNPEIRSPDGRCLGPAMVHLSREHVVGIANGWERVFRLAASMEYRGGSIVVHEQVTAEDRDPRDPGRPPRAFRTTDADRVIHIERGGLRSSGIPLFDRAIRAHGSTQLPIAPAPDNGGQSGSGRGRTARR
ncbi:MAG TPA: hypothetical protein VIL20_21010, partial [Sandaracinaceae bacterium]